MEGFVELLNNLHVTTEDVVSPDPWVRLLGTLQTPEGTQLLSHWYWELLVELAILQFSLVHEITYNPQIMTFLAEAQEWNKLKYSSAVLQIC